MIDKLKNPDEHPLKRILKEKNIPQVQAAFHLGISQTLLSNILRGWIAPNEETEAKIREFQKKILCLE